MTSTDGPQTSTTGGTRWPGAGLAVALRAGELINLGYRDGSSGPMEMQKKMHRARTMIRARRERVKASMPDWLISPLLLYIACLL